jgi:hypothetical protein
MINLSPLDIPVTDIDGMLYDTVAIEAMGKSMGKTAAVLITELKNKLTSTINNQTNTCVINIDDYIKWYYSFATSWGKTWESIKGFFTGEKDASTRYVIQNYEEKIGRGVNLESGLMNDISGYQQIMLDLAILYGVSLDYFSIDDSIPASYQASMTGDEYMVPYTVIYDYINATARKLSNVNSLNYKTITIDDNKVVETANFVVNFLPGVGFIAGFGIDFLTLKIQQWLNGDKLKQQIEDAIRQSQQEMLAAIQN